MTELKGQIIQTGTADVKRMPPTRILHIIATVDPAAGGPSESVRILLGFKDIGYLGEVVTLDAADGNQRRGPGL